MDQCGACLECGKMVAQCRCDKGTADRELADKDAEIARLKKEIKGLHLEASVRMFKSDTDHNLKAQGLDGAIIVANDEVVDKMNKALNVRAGGEK